MCYQIPLMHGYNMRQSVCFKVLIQLQDCEFCHLRVNEHLTKYSRYFSVFLLKEKSEQHFFYWWRIYCYGKVFPSCCIITAFLKNKTSLLKHLCQPWVTLFKCDIVLLHWFMLHDLHDRITIYFSSVGSKKKNKDFTLCLKFYSGRSHDL